MGTIWKRFALCDNVAITVEWVVLTAAVVGLGLTAAVATQNSTDTVADNAQAFFEGYEIGR